MTKTKKISALPLYYKLLNSKNKYVLFRGSTRSGKTIAIIQYILTMLIKHKGLHIVIGVETMSSASGNIIKDFNEWIQIFNIVNQMKINLATNTYTYIPTKSIIRFLPCDKETKWYGTKSDILWFNEAPHIPYSIFETAQMRVPDKKGEFDCKIILDYNPTNPYSWVRELEFKNPPGGLEIHTSTFYDNPFIGENQRKLYESWKISNYNKWLVFGMGEWGEIAGCIYTNWDKVEIFPKEINKVWYGLDFGFTNDPTSLVKVGLQNGEVYVEELLYEIGLTNQDICNKFVELGISNRDEIIADSAEPKSIEEIYRQGWNIQSATKGPGSVNAGIDLLQSYKINIVDNSNNLIDEIVNYTWKKDKEGNYINTPVDNWNHALDALRYVGLLKLNNSGPTKFISRRIGARR